MGTSSEKITGDSRGLEDAMVADPSFLGELPCIACPWSAVFVSESTRLRLAAGSASWIDWFLWREYVLMIFLLIQLVGALEAIRTTYLCFIVDIPRG